jgi:hypothetical protein
MNTWKPANEGVETSEGLIKYLYYPYKDECIRLVPKGIVEEDGSLKVKNGKMVPWRIDGQLVYALPGGGIVLGDEQYP